MASPLKQFEIQTIAPLSLGGVDISFTNSALYMLIGIVVTTLLFVIGMRQRALVPGRLQAFSEMLYDFVGSMIRDNIGDDGKKYFPFVFALFMFVLMGNLLGLLPYSFTYTSHIIVTFGLAVIVFITVLTIGFLRHGFHYLTLFCPNGLPLAIAPVMIMVELISYCSRPISLSVRLFANMLAGHTMLKVIAGFGIGLGVFGALPTVFNAALLGFELFIALIQAYIFTLLTCLYLYEAEHLH